MIRDFIEDLLALTAIIVIIGGVVLLMHAAVDPSVALYPMEHLSQ